MYKNSEISICNSVFNANKENILIYNGKFLYLFIMKW